MSAFDTSALGDGDVEITLTLECSLCDFEVTQDVSELSMVELKKLNKELHQMLDDHYALSHDEEL